MKEAAGAAAHSRRGAAQRTGPPLRRQSCLRTACGGGLRPALTPETTAGLYKTECTRAGSPFRAGPIRTLADLEKITSAWVHWYNTSRLMHRLGRRPPAEAEAEYWRQARDAA